MKRDSGKIYFSIPDFWEHYKLNCALMQLWLDERDKFNDDIVIDSIYGSFPCIWNGGRYVNGETSIANIINTLQPFHNAGLSIRYTFTNCLIEEKHLQDTFGNIILKTTDQFNADGIQNGVNVHSPLMKEYIEKYYPKYYTMWSTTLCEKDITKINELSKDNLVVVDYTINNNFNVIDQLKHPENIEFLAVEYCHPNCPYRQQHYLHHSKQQMHLESETFHCKMLWPVGISPYYNATQLPQYISLDNIRKNYLPRGFNQFKFTGRRIADVHIIEEYVNYLIKIEYQDEIRNRLLDSLFGY